MNIVLFGAGHNGVSYKKYVEEQGSGDKVIAFLDNRTDKPLILDKQGVPIPIYSPSEIVNLSYDKLIITNSFYQQICEIKKQLDRLNVPKEKIGVLSENEDLMIMVHQNVNAYNEKTDSRVNWLKNYSQYVNEMGIQGNVAECGVFRGDFAHYINKYFPDRTLYLFDTFDGFDQRDLDIERSLNNTAFLCGEFNSREFFAYGSEQLVLKRLPFRDKCVVKKGFFPDTAVGVDDRFCFVNLDTDLYQPILAGLRFFYDKMYIGGVILVHDYFNHPLPGVRQAIQAYENEVGCLLSKMPIGDFCSLAIVKT